MRRNSYTDQVFINCPFDKQYLNMFRACTFAVLDAGFVPRCSLEIEDGTQFRLSAILKMIKNCRYGIHDLSRVDLDSRYRLPRFNMPFEFGVFYSAKHFGSSRQKQKACLVLEKEKFRYQKFMSDIAGIDVTPHGNAEKKLVMAIRNWLVTTSRRKSIPAGEEIYNRFKVFQAEIRRLCRKRSIGYDTMPFVDLVDNMTKWLKLYQVRSGPLFGP